MRVWLARVPATAMRAELPYISHYMNEVAALSWRFEAPWLDTEKESGDGMYYSAASDMLRSSPSTPQTSTSASVRRAMAASS